MTCYIHTKDTGVADIYDEGTTTTIRTTVESKRIRDHNNKEDTSEQPFFLEFKNIIYDTDNIFSDVVMSFLPDFSSHHPGNIIPIEVDILFKLVIFYYVAIIIFIIIVVLVSTITTII